MMACKHANCTNFGTFGGSSTQPPSPIRAKFGTRVASGSTLTCRIWTQLVYSVALGMLKTANFAQFSTFTCSGGATWRRTEKVERGCTTTNFSLSNDIKIVSILQRYLDEVVSTNYVIQQRDGQTNRHTDKKTQRFWPQIY